MDQSELCFIGGGNMAASLIGGLIADGYPPDRIRVADPYHHVEFPRTYMATVARALGPELGRDRPLVVSVAAGIRTDDLGRWLGTGLPLVRCMPNTRALVQSGATALFATPAVSEAQRELAESILRAVGLTLWLDDEDLMDAVTALSGSGPAYFFLLMEAMAAAGEELGLDADAARLLTLQTAFGAAKMALESDEGPGQLRARVTSPGGTTERALAAFENGGFRELVTAALRAARDRSRELAEQLGKD